MNKKLFLLAGESSGDLHGGALMEVLSTRGSWQIDGIGGPRMRTQGMTPLFPMEELQVMGFVKIACALPKIIRQFKQVKEHILANQYDIVVLIDYPGFNLRLAKALRKSGYRGKIVQMISPTVWAWGKGRIKTLADNFDRLLTIFPFEKNCFSHTNLDVSYIGHPLIDKIKNYSYDESWHKTYGISTDKPLVAIFPGSRSGEIASNLPRMLKLAETLSTPFAISCARDDLRPLIEKQVTGRAPIIASKHSYELMKTCHTAIAVSGTATLELALHATPTTVVYHVPLINGIIARYLIGINLPYYCISNILMDKQVFPEFIDYFYPKKRIEKALGQMHHDEDTRKKCIADCETIRKKLDSCGVMERAADAIEELIDG